MKHADFLDRRGCTIKYANDYRDPDTGDIITVIERVTPYGDVVGRATCKLGDNGSYNRWIGYEIAERRCFQQYCHKKGQEHRARARGMKELIDNVAAFCDENMLTKLKNQHVAMLKRAETYDTIYSNCVTTDAKFCEDCIKSRQEFEERADKVLGKTN